MHRDTGVLILVCVLAPVSWLAADSGNPREVVQNVPTPGEQNANAKTDAKPGGKTSGKSDAKPGGKASGDGRSRAKAAPGITPEREAAVKTFVEQHHAELASLLLRLKENNPQEYGMAIRDLFRASERLARVHETDADRYELELKLWQIQSRIELLGARYRMAGGDAAALQEIQESLRRAIAEQFDLRKAVLRLERERTSERLKKLDEQLQALETADATAVERQLRSLIGAAGPKSLEKPLEKNPPRARAK